MNKELLSIKEFSELAGISKQAVYSQLDSRLKPFLVQVDGKKMLKKEALEKFYSTKFQPSFNQVSSQVEQPNSTTDAEQGQTNLSIELIEMLKEEIKKKDQQIEKLQQRLDHAQDLIADMAQKAQYITAADKTEKIMLQQPKEDQGKIIEPAAAAENQDAEKRNNTEEKPKKKWFQFWK